MQWAMERPRPTTELQNPRALVLFSGGLDSTTTLAVARSEGRRPLALIFDYGQRHRVEVRRACALAGELGVEWRLERIDLRAVGGSALTSDEIEVPRGRSDQEIGAGGIPVTYVPARNTIFLAHALSVAEVEEIDDIYVGVNAIDYSGYPDCRPEYLRAFEGLANLASRRAVELGHPVRIHAPLLELRKAEIIRRGLELGVDYARTWSCYAPRRRPGRAERDGQQDEQDEPGGDAWVPCRACDSCLLRERGFREAGVEDPLLRTREGAGEGEGEGTPR